MKFFRNIKKWLFGTGYEVGEQVFWDNRVHPEFTGEYVITSQRDKNGYVGIYNKKMKHRVVPYYYLKPLNQ